MNTTFRKQSPEPTTAFRYEAAGLAWLGAAHEVDVVEVLAVDDHSITLPRLTRATPDAQTAIAFGAALARLHAAGADGFGAPPEGWSSDGWIGTQQMTLDPTPTWGEFYAAQRLWPFAEDAHRLGNLSHHGLADVARVCDRLRAGDFDDDAPPARIHGDLWSGNVMWTDRGVVVIDPAAHGGHPLTDLAMLSLFGAPYLGEIITAYLAEAGKPDEWTAAIPLHQLHPLLVHAVTHGSGYGQEAARVAKRWARA